MEVVAHDSLAASAVSTINSYFNYFLALDVVNKVMKAKGHFYWLILRSYFQILFCASIRKEWLEAGGLGWGWQLSTLGSVLL